MVTELRSVEEAWQDYLDSCGDDFADAYAARDDFLNGMYSALQLVLTLGRESGDYIDALGTVHRQLGGALSASSARDRGA